MTAPAKHGAQRQGPSHGYFCEAAADCHEPPVECFYPPTYTEDGTPVDEVAWLCLEHARQSGFCLGCHTFWGGVESFEFGRHPGYCDNCGHEIDRDMADEFESDDYDPDPAGVDFDADGRYIGG